MNFTLHRDLEKIGMKMRGILEESFERSEVYPSFSPFLKSEEGDSKGQSPFVMNQNFSSWLSQSFLKVFIKIEMRGDPSFASFARVLPCPTNLSPVSVFLFL